MGYKQDFKTVTLLTVCKDKRKLKTYITFSRRRIPHKLKLEVRL